MTEEEKEKLKDAIALLREADKEFERNQRYTDIFGKVITTLVVSYIIFLVIGGLILMLIVNS